MRNEPMRTQRDGTRTQDTPLPSHRSKRRVKESDSSNNYPIIVGPLTTNQDLVNVNGEKIYNLPLMIQQPFLREKKEPIKVDISVKLVPKPRKKEKKKREEHVDEIICTSPDGNKGVKNNISMEVTDSNIRVLSESLEVVDDTSQNINVSDRKNSVDVVEMHNIENKCENADNIRNVKEEMEVNDMDITIEPKVSEANDSLNIDAAKPTSCSTDKESVEIEPNQLINDQEKEN